VSLWKDTGIERLRGEFREQPKTAMAYALGNIELRVFLLFGCEPESNDVPDEAREVALLLLQALLFGADMETTSRRCEQIASGWLARVKGSAS
jgi:hypothetical protein